MRQVRRAESGVALSIVGFQAPHIQIKFAMSEETFLTAVSEKLLENAKLVLSVAVGGLLEYAGHAAHLERNYHDWT